MEKNLHISGMHCHHCVNAVKVALEGLNNVEVKAVEIGSATVDTDVDDEMLSAAIAREGYSVDRVS